MRRLVNRTAVIAGLIAVLAAAGCTQKNNGPA
ncbi:MAG: hypothetical protein QOC75_3938, partial [Pseudonocardiales bacterium]|nr:hypothetical protein [Pseudonocardiales bacterium]MDT7669306.1 hypothetical protein [Pseudonocardiales bacterium]